MRRFAGPTVAAVFVLGLSCWALAKPDDGVAVRRSLDMTLPEVKFQGASLADCFEFLRDISGANLHVNWRALEAAGISKDVQVNVRLRAVSLRKVLRTLLSEAAGGGVNLTFYAEDGVIEVTTAEIADQQMITKVYPIEDLIMEIPSFDNAPDFSLQNTSNSGGGGSRGGGRSGGSRGGGGGYGGGGGGSSLFGGGGGGGGGDRAKEQTTSKTERAEQLVTLVRETVRPDIWRENGGPASIRYYNGHLVVTAPRSVHEALSGSF